MEAIKNLLFKKAEKLALRIISKRSSFRQWYISQRDDAMGRELIGIDKFGNSYYQYYSFHGLPTRRMVMYKFFDTNKFHIDPHFLGWLRRNDNQPPTQHELERLYLEHDAFIERAIAWDEEQRVMIEEYKEKMKILEEKYEREKFQFLEQGEQMLKIENWVPGSQPKQLDADEPETSAVIEMTEIDKLEIMYFEEYKKIREKDKEKNKDFNILMYDELKQAKYYFEYLRTSEKLYKHEVQTGRIKVDKNDQATNEFQEVNSKTPQDDAKNQEILNERLSQETKRKLEIARKKDEKKQQIRQDSHSRSYSQFKEEFKDIFEDILDRKNQTQQQDKKM
ncbi:ndufa12 domain containing protein [Stylonychia lemnae]|uniref:NADH dehydrogenase [ubiquinone] 1 alpha subcomplex subunit 12 n=1 Tax=Stylonychia lemnae TaxID=5949 RepID=A0A077ZR16_STYLE|nr:ndufa12 domain containing protein [Stylonychia lemnae]|eukprot:CDW72353.1 ndufa12 domain containing protein [Stylonychia lemnae]